MNVEKLSKTESGKKCFKLIDVFFVGSRIKVLFKLLAKNFAA
jgi:hypothetical protein